jgi:hypothetical protein
LGLQKKKKAMLVVKKGKMNDRKLNCYVQSVVERVEQA